MLTRVELKITPTYSTHLPPPFHSLWNMASSIQGWRVLQYNAGAVLAFRHHCVYIFFFLSVLGALWYQDNQGKGLWWIPLFFCHSSTAKVATATVFKSQFSKHNEGQQYHLETPPPTHDSKDVVSLTSSRCLNCLVRTPGGLNYQTLHSFGSLKNTLF